MRASGEHGSSGSGWIVDMNNRLTRLEDALIDLAILSLPWPQLSTNDVEWRE
jgi:hypothetical protein